MGNCHIKKDPVIPIMDFNMLNDIDNCRLRCNNKRFGVNSMIKLMQTLDKHLETCTNDECDIKKIINECLVITISYKHDNKNTKFYYIKSGIYKRMNIKNKQEICTICMNEFDDKDIISNTVCQHQYHYECLLELLKYTDKCACCRKEIM